MDQSLGQPKESPQVQLLRNRNAALEQKLKTCEDPHTRLRLLQAAVDAMPEGVAVFDPEGVPIHFNPVAKKVTEGNSGSLQGVPKNAQLKPLGENGTVWGTLAIFPQANIKPLAAATELEPEYKVLAET